MMFNMSGGHTSIDTSGEPPLMQVNPPKSNSQIQKTMSGKDRAPSLGYCDFCLGDASENKKTGRSEELVSCAECGRSGNH